MACPWPSTLLPLLLLLINLLLPQALSASIPSPPSAAKRETVLEVPDCNNSAFATTILDHVNAFRAEQDAQPLEYDAGLAGYAAGLASQCDIESKFNGPYGDILTGGSPSIFGRDSWDGFSLNDAASDLIQGWYNANFSYIADPTFQILPYGRSYTQLVWKASTHIGCAWTPASCKFQATSAFYLRCTFSPKGNIDGQFDENVSCNGCPERRAHQVGKTTSLDLHERQSTGSAFGDLLLVMINKIRADARVPPVRWDGYSAIIGKTLAEKCAGKPQKGEVVGKTIVGSPPFGPTWDATKDTVNTWGAEPHTSDITKSPNYAVITDKSHTSFGCGWNDNVCPGNTWYLHCFFGNLGGGISGKTRSISERQSGGLDLDMNDYSLILTTGINAIRKDAGQPDIEWSDKMTKAAWELLGECIDSPVMLGSQVTFNYEWPAKYLGEPNFTLMSLIVGGSLKSTKPSKGQSWTPYTVPEYIKVSEPQWTNVGCSWSRNCTAIDNYVLYCEFADSEFTSRAPQVDLDARDDPGFDLQTTMGDLFYTVRSAAHAEWTNLVPTKGLFLLSYFDADTCSGKVTRTETMQMIYSYSEEEVGKLTDESLTDLVVTDLYLQQIEPDKNARPNIDIMLDRENRQYGCAWSKKCAPMHYLFCNFYDP